MGINLWDCSILTEKHSIPTSAVMEVKKFVILNCFMEGGNTYDGVEHLDNDIVYPCNYSLI